MGHSGNLSCTHGVRLAAADQHRAIARRQRHSVGFIRDLIQANILRQLRNRLLSLIFQDAGIGIPLFLASIDGHTSKLKGLSPIPLGGLMGYNFAENVWLEA